MQRDFKKAKQNLLKIARTNRKELPDFHFKEELKAASARESEKLTVTNKGASYSYIDLFRYKSLRYSTIGGSIMFFSIYFVYYGSTFSLNTVAGNLYINALVASGAELLAYMVTVPIATNVNRKTTFISTFLIAGIFAFSFIFLTIPPECLTPGVSCPQKTLQTVFVAVMLPALVNCHTFFPFFVTYSLCDLASRFLSV